MKSNFALGFRRLSIVFWGMGILVCLLVSVAGVVMAVQHGYSSDVEAMLWGGIAGAAVFVALHKITCWVIAGFTSPT